jgi:starch synthase
MRVALLTKEYPPDVYGGAGVHVEFLARELAKLATVEVRRFGAPSTDLEGNPAVRGFEPWAALGGPELYRSALRTISMDLAMSAGLDGADLVHSHTWYANFAGHLAKLLYGVPHVMTTHSLEPLRPWKAEQLGPGGYALSSFCERTAIESADGVIAVSGEMRADVLAAYPAVEPARVHVIHNGIDPDRYRPVRETDVLDRYGISPAMPTVVFVGRVTRQKGIEFLLEAAHQLDPGVQLVLSAGAADTPELAAEVERRVLALGETRERVVWIEHMLDRDEIVQILSHATVFCCPSIYEPLGIVNLEAMACAVPVVATDTGGIPEVVQDGVTGLLVPFETNDPLTRAPARPSQFVDDIAARLSELLSDPGRAKAMGESGRARVVAEFSWAAVARQVFDLYRTLVPDGPAL